MLAIKAGLLTMVAQKHRAGLDIVLLCHMSNLLVFEQWASCAAERGVGGDVDVLLFAEVANLLLWAVWVILNLIGSRSYLGGSEQLFKEWHTKVTDTNGLDFASLEKLFHFFPSLRIRPRFVKVSRAVRKLGQIRVIAIWAGNRCQRTLAVLNKNQLTSWVLASA